VRTHLLPIDLEWSALQSASSATLDALTPMLTLPVGSREETLRRLGSNYGQGPIVGCRKDPWMRGVIARELPWSEVANDIKGVLQRWLVGAGIPEDDAATLLRRA
jgi:hypothetical protein